MGSGKGAVDQYVAVIKPGMVLFEIAGVPEALKRSIAQGFSAGGRYNYY